MTTKIAINGFGRIGRLVMRAVYEGNRNDIEVVAINDLAPAKTNAHLLKYDSVHGKFNEDVVLKGDKLVVNGKEILITQERDPASLPWKDLDVDVVMECTGIFKDREGASKYFEAGAKKVLISAPGKDEDITVVYGVNHGKLKAEHKIVSNASCTTNCLAPMVHAIGKKVEIEKGFMTTIHAYTGDQPTLDTAHKDLHRARAAACNMIPTSTGAAIAVGKVIPELSGKLFGVAVRVPTPNVSLVDLTFTVKDKITVDEINNAIKEAADGDMKGILGYYDEPLVSSDFNHDSRSSIFSLEGTKVTQDNLVRVMSWYDNEWGFSCRMLDTAALMASL